MLLSFLDYSEFRRTWRRLTSLKRTAKTGCAITTILCCLLSTVIIYYCTVNSHWKLKVIHWNFQQWELLQCKNNAWNTIPQCANRTEHSTPHLEIQARVLSTGGGGKVPPKHSSFPPKFSANNRIKNCSILWECDNYIHVLLPVSTWVCLLHTYVMF